MKKLIIDCIIMPIIGTITGIIMLYIILDISERIHKKNQRA